MTHPLGPYASGSETARPRCAVCQKPVETIAWWDDQLSCKRVFVVRCHGDEERTVVTDELLAGADGLCFGRAFDRHQLPVRTEAE